MGTYVDEGSGTESLTEDAGFSGTSGCDWTREEQTSLDQALLLYPAHQYPIAFERTILVAALVPTRSARDVALRINWLTTKSCNKSQELKRRGTLPTSTLMRVSSLQSPSPTKSPNSKSFSRASVPKYGGITLQPQSNKNVAPTSASDQQNAPLQLTIPPPLSTPLLPALTASCLFQTSSPPTNSNSSDDGCVNIGVLATSTAIFEPDAASAKLSSPSPSPCPSAAEQPVLGKVQSLIDQNHGILINFKTNMQQCRVVENTELLVRLRDNIVACLNQIGNLPSTVSTLPPLPVQLNLELACKFLPHKMILPPGVPPFSFNPAFGPPPMMLPPGLPLPAPGMIPMPLLGAQPGMMPPFSMGLPPTLMNMQLPMSVEPTASGFVPSTSSTPLSGPSFLPQSVPLSAMGTPGNVLAIAAAGMVPLTAVQPPIVRPPLETKGKKGESSQ